MLLGRIPEERSGRSNETEGARKVYFEHGFDQFVIGGNGIGLISGVISGSNAVVRSMTGSGTWTLTGDNLYTGGTVINGGTLAIILLSLQIFNASLTHLSDSL